LLGYWIHGLLRVLIGYGPTSFWTTDETSPEIFSFEHGQGEKTKKKKIILYFVVLKERMYDGHQIFYFEKTLPH
jgi:hypothetical protein